MRTSIGLLPILLSLLACGERVGTSDDETRNDEPERPASGMREVDPPPMNVAAHDADVRAPMDATPSPDGASIYYTALTRDSAGDQVAGVFRVAAAGGGAIDMLAVGGMMIAPVGISISLDGKRLFVADSGTVSDDGVGAILALATSGGEPSRLSGTAGYVPRGIAIAKVGGKERLYFTGRDPKSGEHGVFAAALAGGNVERIATGAPFADPAGVTVTDKGDVYVIDGLAGGVHAGVIRVRDERAQTVVADIGVGFPAGIAATRDAKTVLVSGLDPTTRRDRVYLLDTASGDVSVIRDTFDAFSEPAGLHRAHDADVFAWADSEADHDGSVYVIKL